MSYFAFMQIFVSKDYQTPSKELVVGVSNQRMKVEIGPTS